MSNKEKRMNRIIDTLNEHGFMTVDEIHHETHIAKMTIRSDLYILCNEGKVNRVRHSGTSDMFTTINT